MNCVVEIKDKLIVLKDPRSKPRMIFANSAQVTCKKYRVDGCLITAGNRCDFLLIDQNGSEFYVELKGSDVKHGCEQIETSIITLTRNINAPKHSFVVSSSVPRVNGFIQIKKKQFKKQYNSQLIIKNSSCTHQLN